MFLLCHQSCVFPLEFPQVTRGLTQSCCMRPHIRYKTPKRGSRWNWLKDWAENVEVIVSSKIIEFWKEWTQSLSVRMLCGTSVHYRSVKSTYHTSIVKHTPILLDLVENVSLRVEFLNDSCKFHKYCSLLQYHIPRFYDLYNLYSIRLFSARGVCFHFI